MRVRGRIVLLARRYKKGTGLRKRVFPPRLMIDLTEAERAAVAAMWLFRAKAEQETAATYSDLANRLREGGAPAEMVARVEAAGHDEIRHRDLCAALAGRLGSALPPWTSARLRRIAPHDLNGGVRLLYEMVALFCVTESINATLLLRSWEQAHDASARELLHALLTDEVEHSRIGWAYLATVSEWRSAVSARLPVILAATTHDETFLVEPFPLPDSPALVAHGMLPRDELRRVFSDAMQDVVLPGLDLCGFDTTTARAWLDDCTRRWAY